MSVRLYKLAKELGFSSKDLVKKLKDLHIDVKGHMSAIDEDTAEIVRHELLDEKKKIKKVAAKKKPALKKIQVKMPLTVKELSIRLQIGTTELIKKLMKMNILVNINQNLKEEVLIEIGPKLGVQFERKPTDEEVLLSRHQEPDDAGVEVRGPIVTFMGHVDHGKTSLLDIIRQSNITARESGGITQHIGAYEVTLDKGKITFLDTPGHEAFTAMRARGANITDIVILVIAAEDGVMPQTVEAINHAKAASVPIVVAINKIDLPGANIDNVKRQLSELGLMSEDWGGKTITVSVSAKKKTGIEQLLEMILLEAELLELKCNSKKPARGVIIESKLSKGSGPTATILIQNGSLHAGDVFVCGLTYGKVKAMSNDLGERIQEAGPSVPVEIFGLSHVPQVGDKFYVVEDEKKAKELSLQKNKNLRDQTLIPNQRASLEELFQKIKEGQVKELKIILKADVQGSLEALTDSLEKLSTKDVRVEIMHAQVGSINESDVMLAVASDAVIIGFHVNIDSKAKEIAEKKHIEVRFYRIIYELLNDVRLSMEGLLEPTIKEVFLGRAKVLQVFKIDKVGKIAGCTVVKGKMMRNAELIRLFRNEQCLYEGKFSSLKRYKDDVKEAGVGLECGIALDKFFDLLPDDLIECYRVEKVARKL